MLIDANLNNTKKLQQLEPLELKVYQNLQQAGAVNQLVVAFSGGLDSKTLISVLVRLRELKLIKALSAIHVNHQLQVEADDWAERCKVDCLSLNIAFSSEKLAIAKSNLSNIEEQARLGRYQVFENLLQKSQWLLMAHHQDDQAETLLFRLLRGCGVHGAAAMPKTRRLAQGNLLRPMLNCSKASILAYAEKHHLTWINDPSNLSEIFSRNFLRQQVLPKIKQKWPGYTKTLNRFALLAKEQSELLDEVAAHDLSTSIVASSDNLLIDKLTQLSPLRQKNLLHYWGKLQTGFSPASNEITQLISQLPATEKTAIEVSFGGGIVRSFAKQLFLLRDKQPLIMDKKIPWQDLSQVLLLTSGVKLTKKKSVSLSLRKPNLNEKVWVSFRQGGERCLPSYRDKSTSLKNIYQELNVPPWQREWLPIIYYNNELVTVPGFFVAKKYLSENIENSINITIEISNS